MTPSLSVCSADSHSTWAHSTGHKWHAFESASIPGREVSDRELLVKSPLVSVHMITYNHAKFIADAIEGVLHQQGTFPMELVIGEDCSTDGTREIVSAYQKKHPKIVRIVTADINVGTHRNWIRTCHACRAKYIAWCEGDDCWHDPLKLQKQVDVLEANPEIGLVHCDVHREYESTGKRLECVHWAKQHEHDDRCEDMFARVITGEYRLWTCSVCARMELIRRVIEQNPLEFQSERFLMSDTPLWLELSRITRFRYLDEPLATQRHLLESASKSQSPARLLRFLRSGREMREHYLEKYSCDATLRRRVLIHGDRRLLDQAFFAKDRNAANVIVAALVHERGHIQGHERFIHWWGSGGPITHHIGFITLHLYYALHQVALSTVRVFPFLERLLRRRFQASR